MRSKLDGKFKWCIFLDYAHKDFRYRLWDPIDKVIINKDVFLEYQTIKDFENIEKPIYH